jgi:transmembrane sensor
MAWDRKQKEVADRRVTSGSPISEGGPFEIRDVLTDDPTPVELGRAGAKSTVTRATDIEQQASEWLIRSEAGNFTQGMQAELDRWLQDPNNRGTFLRLKAAWRRADRFGAARPFDGNVDVDLLKGPTESSDTKKNNRGSPWSFRVSTAAAIALSLYLLGVTAWLVLGRSDWISYTTSVGGYEHVTLADGSVLQLNTDSEVRARITADKREIELVRGEALIKAANDPHRPLTVTAANTTARAAPSRQGGTAFVVRLRPPKSVDISVTDGTITVGSTSTYRVIDVALRRYFSADSTLTAGDTATFRPEGVHFARVGLDELNRKLSWTAGLLSFQGETLAQVTDEFNRYNRRQLLVTDPSIADRQIGGAFQATDPDSFVSALEKWFDVHADEQLPAPSGDTVIRLRGTKRR